MLLEGLHIPLTTPFHPDGRLNLPKLAANVARRSKSPAAGLVVLGASGEPTLLTDEETRDVLRAAAQAAAPEKVLIAGISRDSVRATLALAEFAGGTELRRHPRRRPLDLRLRSSGRDRSRKRTIHIHAAAANSCFTSRPSPTAPRSPSFYSATATTAFPWMPQSSSPPIPTSSACWTARPAPPRSKPILRRTATIKREVTVTTVFRAVTARMKIAAGRAPATLVSADSLAADRAASATAAAETPPIPPLRTRTKSVGFQVLAGDTQAILESLRAGAVGAAPAFAACAPQACYEVFAAWKDDDQPLAEEKQARLHEAARLAEATPGSLKFACDLNGYFGGLPRLPQLPPTGIQRAALEQRMKQLRN